MDMNSAIENLFKLCMAQEIGILDKRFCCECNKIKGVQTFKIGNTEVSLCRECGTKLVSKIINTWTEKSLN